MSENLNKTKGYLENMPSDHADNIRDKLNALHIFEESGEGLRPLWDVGQSEVDRIIDDITKITTQAYKKLEEQRKGESRDVSPDAVWRESLDLVSLYVLNTCLESEKDPSSEELDENADKSIETALIMEAINVANLSGSHLGFSVINRIDGSNEVRNRIPRVIRGMEGVGLAVRDNNNNFMPIASMFSELSKQEMLNLNIQYILDSLDELDDDIDKDFNDAVQSDSWYDLQFEISGTTWNDIAYEDIEKIVNKMIDIAPKFIELRNNLNFEDAEPLCPIFRMLYAIPTDELKKMYFGDSVKATKLAEFLKNSSLDNDIEYQDHLVVLKRIYEDRGGIIALNKGEDEAVDRIKSPDKIDRYLSLIPAVPEDKTKKNLELYKKETNRIISEFLSRSGIEPKLVMDYRGASYNRFCVHSPNKVSAYYNPTEVRECLGKINQNIKDCGAGMINMLNRELGLINIDNFSSDDIKDMSDLLDIYKGENKAINQDLLNKLRNGDTMVVFVDAYGDWNGAFTNTANKYRGGDKNKTLFFEVGSRNSDIYRRLAMLKKINVKPSTVVLSAHGAPGYLSFGSTQLSADKAVGAQGISSKIIPMNEVNIRKIVDEYMVSIDSETNPDKGNKRIIMDSCSGDKAFSQNISSTAEAIIRNAWGYNTVVYAPNDVTTVNRYEDDIFFRDTTGNQTTLNRLKLKLNTGRPRVLQRERLDSLYIER